MIPNSGAAESCRQCVVSGQVQDPYACQTCIFDTCTKDASGNIIACDAAARDRCYDCVKQYPKGPGSKEYYYSCSACEWRARPLRMEVHAEALRMNQVAASPASALFLRTDCLTACAALP